jgi:stage II sporulation protein M
MQKKMLRHIKANRWQYSLIAGAFLAGIILGRYKSSGLASDVEFHLRGLVEQFIGGADFSWSRLDIFWRSFRIQAAALLAIWFLGLTIIGIPVILLIVGYKGFALGFTVGFLIYAQQGMGLLMIAVSVLPQNLVYIPALLIWSVLAVNFSRFIVYRWKNGPRLGLAFVRYSLLLLLFTVIMMGGSLVETVLTPVLLNFIR